MNEKDICFELIKTQQQRLDSVKNAYLKSIKTQQQRLDPIKNAYLESIKTQQQRLDPIKNAYLESIKTQQQRLDPIKNAYLKSIKTQQQGLKYIREAYLEVLDKQAKILKSIITSSLKLSPFCNIKSNFDKNKNIIYNLWSIDWYIPMWRIPVTIDSTYINTPLDTQLLTELDNKLFDQLKTEINCEKNFLKYFDDNDIDLFYLYKNKFYKDVVLLSLIRIEFILTNFINYLHHKEIPNLHDYLTGDRKEYHTFTITQKKEYKKKLENLKQSTNDTFDQNALLCLIYLFSDDSPSQLYYNFDGKNKRYQCKLTPNGEVPLCRNLFLHGFGYDNDVSQKLAIKALFAYQFFKEFSINK